MARRSSPSSIPAYQHHRASGQARVCLSGRQFYLGPYRSKESRAKYDRLVAEWMASGRQALPGQRSPSGGAAAPGTLTVTELIDRYFTFAEQYYLKNGEPTSERACILQALQRLKRLYGPTPAAQFGPLALQAIQQSMVGESLARRTINGHIDRVRRCFRWAVAQALVAPSVHQALTAVPGLKAGRCTARETEPVGPVDDKVVEATLMQLTPTLADMVRVQRLTGMRSGALCRLTRGAIDMSGPIWFYEDTDHKTAHHGKKGLISIGPRAQAILTARFKQDLEAPLFSPREAFAEHAREKRAARKTIPTAAQLRRDAKRARKAPRRERAPGEWYTPDSYRVAVQRAAYRAFPHQHDDADPATLTAAQAADWKQWREAHRWHPHQLRHTYASEAHRLGFAIEDVSAALNHSNLDTTMIYVERCKEQAARVAAQVG
jgi:integrase